MDDGRYARQLTLRGFGPVAQAALQRARVLVVGVGGLGSPAAMYLAAAGVGTLTLVDRDVVDVTNLHRQLLYTTPDVGRPKLTVARERLAALNPHVTVVTHETHLRAENADALVSGHDVVIDATDNFPARYALNDACLRAGIPFVYGSVARFEGQCSVFAAPDGPCYRCLFPVPPAPGSVPTCAEEGVLGVVPGVLGLYQATEAIKLLTGTGAPLVGTLLMLDLLSQETQRIRLARRADCPACGSAARTQGATATGASVAVSATSPLLEPTAMAIPDLEATTLAARLVRGPAPVLLDVREPWEYERAHIAGSVLMPLATLPTAASSLAPDTELVVICHHGVRSAMAAQWLVSQGFTRVSNLTGGIDAWSREVDAAVPRY